MSAYGIAGLVDGFFKGREIRTAKEDREYNKKRQEKMDGFYEAEQRRAAERQDWARAQNGRVVTDWQQQQDDEAALRRAAQEAIDATDAALGAAPPPSQAPSVNQSTMGAPPRPQAPTGGTGKAGTPAPQPVSTDAAPPPANRSASPAFETNGRSTAYGAVPPAPQSAGPAFEANGRGQPQQPQLQPSPPQNGPAGRQLSPAISDELYQSGPVGRVTQRSPQEQQARQPAEQQPQQQPAYGRAAQPAIGSQQQPGVDFSPNPDHTFGQSLIPDVVEGAKRGVGYLATGIQQDARAAANAVNATINPYAGYITGGAVEFPQFTGNGWETNYKADRNAAAKSTTGTRDAPPSAAPLGAAPPQAAPAQTGPHVANAPAPSAAIAPAGNVPASAPPATKQLAAVADDAMAAVSTPSMQATADAVAKDEGLGAAGKRPVTEKQRSNAADAYLEHYLKEGAPIYVKELLRQGRTDAAIAFQTYIDQGPTKQGIKHWARAAFAATVGDFDTFSDEIIKGQNVAGYFGDTVKIVKEDSGFTKDEDGNITGAKLILKDETTGNTFEQVFNSPADLVNAGMYFASPEVQFENMQKQVEAAREAALGAAETAKKDNAELDKRIDGQVKAIIEAGPKDALGNPQMSYEEARAFAEQVLTGKAPQNPLGSLPGAGSGASPAGPPVARRP